MLPTKAISVISAGGEPFHDPAAELQLSPTARQYIAGLLRYAPELMLVTNQWVNSYKRLVPGTEAPMYVTWSPRNHSALVRIPELKPGSAASSRIQLSASGCATA